ncbi:hypothetical protein Tco_0776899 [Tanacetum coccineum]
MGEIFLCTLARTEMRSKIFNERKFRELEFGASTEVTVYGDAYEMVILIPDTQSYFGIDNELVDGMPPMNLSLYETSKYTARAIASFMMFTESKIML